MKKVITAQMLLDAKKAGLTAVSVPPGAIITPQALDDARNYGIALQRESAAPAAAPVAPVVQTPVAALSVQAVRNLMAAAPTPPAAAPVAAPVVTGAQPFAAPPAPATMPAGFVAELIGKQVAQHLGSTADMTRINAVVHDVMGEYGRFAPSGAAGPPAASTTIGATTPTGGIMASGISGAATMTTVTGATHPPVQSGNGAILVLGREALPGQNAASGAVIVTDSLIPDAEGPGVGYLQLADSSFDWTFSANEVLVVLEGLLQISGAGLDLKAGPGDAVRVSAGLSCTLTATGRVSCVYSAWPK